MPVIPRAVRPATFLACAAWCALLAPAARAQGTPAPQQNVVTLAAEARREVTQDLLSMTLAATQEGPDAQSVQRRLREALDAALQVARPEAREGDMDIRTGDFGIAPRTNRDGRITGWQGTAELVLQGRDFERITRTAGRITTLTLGHVGFGLSPAQRRQVEAQVQGEAVQNFRARAQELARQFGFQGYTLREVNVSGGTERTMPVMRMRAMAAPAAADAGGVPVEAGKSAVTVNVSGSVQLQ